MSEFVNGWKLDDDTEHLGLYDLAKYHLNVYYHQQLSPIYHC